MLAKLRNRVSISSKSLILNKQYTKIFYIKDYPRYLAPGWSEKLFNPSKKPIAPGVHINVSFHIEKSEYQISTHKMDRLQRSIETAQNSHMVSDGVDKGEEGSLEGLLYLKDHHDELMDMWMNVTITSKNKKDYKHTVYALQKYFKNNRIPHSKLPLEQIRGLSMTWLGGNQSLFKKLYKGRIVDRRTLEVFYPFLSGTISDGVGAYVGHKVSDGTSVHLDFTNNPDNQNMIVVGTSDSGKSTFIKGLTVSLLLEGFKGYIFDCDGEYRALCKKLGKDGNYIDYTGDSGRFVDTTHIEPSLMAEMGDKILDEETLDAIIASDKGRFQNAVDSTMGVISMLSNDFNVDKRNAFSYVLMNMWRDAGIEREHQETWDNYDKEKVSLHLLYNNLKELAKKKDSEHWEGARALAKDLYIFFDKDGIQCHLFKNADDGSWIRNNKLTVFHVADQVDGNTKKHNEQQHIGAIKILMISHMMWQQIKRDRLKKQHYSFEIYDELQRLIKNSYAASALYRGVTTGRKFNDQVIMGFNDPSILFPDNSGIWDNTKYKVFFSIEAKKINELAAGADMPEEVKKTWLNLNKYEYILRVRSGNGDLYDIVKVELPQSEFEKLSKTRGLA